MITQSYTTGADISTTTGATKVHASGTKSWSRRFVPTGGNQSIDRRAFETSTGISDDRAVERTDRERATGEIGGGGKLDRNLLNQAIEIIEAIDPIDRVTTDNRLDSLEGLVCELWRSAVSASQYHQLILADAERSIISAARAGEINGVQISAVRGALKELTSTTLSQANSDSIRSTLIDAGFSPLAIVGDLELDKLVDDD